MKNLSTKVTELQLSNKKVA